MKEEHNLILNCRHCGQKNRIDVQKGLYQTPIVTCGKCKQPIFLARNEKVDFINFRDFIHPMDASAMATLQKIPGLTTILKFVIKHTKEKFYKILYYQNYLKVTTNQFPKVHEIYREALDVLGFDYEPELFVYKSPYSGINAHTYGVDRHFIGVTADAVEMLSEVEMMDLISHELGHIKLDHVLYKMAAEIVANLSIFLAQKTLGLGGHLMAPLQYAFFSWSRASELSADRIALLATKDIKAAHMLTLKLAGGVKDYNDYDYDEFLEQGEIARKMEDESFLTKIYNLKLNSKLTHPFPVWRTGELDHWARTGDYLKVISKNHVTTTDVINDKNVCSNCKNEYSASVDVCPFCGHSDKKEDPSFVDKFKDLFNL